MKNNRIRTTKIEMVNNAIIDSNCRNSVQIKMKYTYKYTHKLQAT